MRMSIGIRRRGSLRSSERIYTRKISDENIDE
jgi:hypothetical protein